MNVKKLSILILAAACLLAGCGTSDETGLQSSSPSGFSSPALVGKVVRPDGAPVGGVEVVVHDRLGQVGNSVVSGQDGAFRISLEAGVYDLGLNLEGDSGSATCFYGPLTIRSEVSKSFVLQSSAGHPPGHVFGRLELGQGVPAAGRRVRFRVGAGRNEVSSRLPDPVDTVTNSVGAFALDLGMDSDAAFDMEVYDGDGALDEWIDVGKLEKPCYMEFATEETSVENRLRCNEADPPDETHQEASRAQSSSFSKFQLVYVAESNKVDLSYGNLPPGHPNSQLKDIVEATSKDIPVFQFREMFDYSEIFVAKTRHWFWHYAVNVKTPQTSTWAFDDAANGGAYQLQIALTSRWHWVSYNSSEPAIQEIDYSTFLP